jgi:predicted Zn-dependent peptidase
MRVAILLALLTSSLHAATPDDPYRLPVSVTRLDNGLTVLVSRDETVSDVAVELWIRAGSADDGPGQHGLAHLFEHVLPGPARVFANPANRSAFDQQRLDSNGMTAADYTRMVQRFPAASVELPIAVLADRMSTSPDVITAADLAKHQQTVAAEFRNGAGRTWDAAVSEPVRRAIFGADHPYGHGGIGSTIDVEATTLDAVRLWFKRWFGASNTTLVVVGNVDPVRVVELARKHFGGIAAGTPLAPAFTPVKPLTERRSLEITAAGSRPAIDFFWPTPGWGDPRRQDLAIAKELLRERFRGSLGCDVEDGDEFEAAAGGAMSLRVRCDALSGIEERMLRELDTLLASTPSIERARQARLASFADALSRLGWRPSRAQLLGEGLLLTGDPLAYLDQIERLRNVSADNAMKSARVWLTNPLIVRVRPAVVDAAAIDRSTTVAVTAKAPATATDVTDASVGGTRLLTVRRNIPLALAHVVPRNGNAESVTATPETFSAELRKTLASQKGAYDLVVVGDVDRSRIEELMREAPAVRSTDEAAETPRFTPRPGAPQTQLMAVVLFEREADPAAVSLAADLLRSRLNDRIREKERWAYSVDARFERRSSGPVVVIEVPIRDDLATKAIPVIEEYVRNLTGERLTAAEASRGSAAELRRLHALSSVPFDVARELVSVVRSGLRYDAYVRSHRRLLEDIREGGVLELPKPASVVWSASGDPDRVDPALR